MDVFGLGKEQTDSDKAICQLCRKSVLAHGGNTSNLVSHLKNHHPKEHSIVAKARKAKISEKSNDSGEPKTRQVTLSEAVERTQHYVRSSKRRQEITTSVTKFIAKEMMPVSVVEREGFKEIVQKLDPRYEVPSRKYFSKNALPSLYTATREKILESMKSLKYYSITTDMWSSGKMEPYMAVTIHYIDKDWVLQSHCLQTLFIPEDHTAENLAPVLRNTLESWCLPENRLTCVTTNNCTNIVAAMRILKWDRLSCFGHNLHLAITNSMKNDTRINRAVDVAHKIINTFAHSWKKRRDLAKAQVELKLLTHSLITVYKYNVIQKYIPSYMLIICIFVC